jgi:tRNA dimethylallyltransferase
MDIGTAKPTPAERATVPHHLVDTLDPTETMTLARFQDEVYALVRAIHARHALPVIAGGTQQYVNAIVEGWRIPRVEPRPDIRARLELEIDEYGPTRLRARLETLDPAAAVTAGPNLRRVIRALEVIEVTGRPMSAQQGKDGTWFASLLVGLTMSRELLYPRIDRRVDEQLATGLVDEVQALLERGVPPDAPALSGIGYRQVLPYLRGEETLETAAERIRHDTHRLVRHQQTWLRKTAGLIEIDVSRHGWFERLEGLVRAFLVEHPIP